MVRWTEHMDGPCAIRYGKHSVDMSETYPCREFTPGKWELMEDGPDAALLAVGSMVESALEMRELLAKHHLHVAVVNCSTVKPMGEDMLRRMNDRPIITLEEHVLTGGFGSVVCAFLSGEGLPALMLSFGIPDTFVQHGRRDQLLKYLGLTPELMTQRIIIALKNGEKHQ